jgi:hypothetical protein
MAVLNDLVTWYIQHTTTILATYVFLLAVLTLLNERELATILRELAVLRRKIEQIRDELDEKTESGLDGKLTDVD